MSISSTWLKRIFAALFLAATLAGTTAANAQSVWDKIKAQAQKGQQQGQPQQKSSPQDNNLLVLLQDDTALKRVSITPTNTNTATLFGGTAGLSPQK